jgi:hypothetical protein
MLYQKNRLSALLDTTYGIFAAQLLRESLSVAGISEIRTGSGCFWCLAYRPLRCTCRPKGWRDCLYSFEYINRFQIASCGRKYAFFHSLCPEQQFG